MIRLREIKVDIEANNFLDKCKKKLKISNINDYKIIKRSIDAREKPNIYYIYTIDIDIDNEEKVIKYIQDDNIFIAPKEEYKIDSLGDKKLVSRPVIVGSGPAGLFCAYLLAEYGYNPLVIERGKKVEDRVKDIEKFWNEGVLNKESNVQFGEGGAGTFSDGKLNTLKKDKELRQKKIFEVFVECGAPEEILYDSNPHIGTDILRNVIKNMRNKIISMGGEFLFNTKLTNLVIEDNKIRKIEVNDKELIDVDILVLALGHSARDTFKMLLEKDIDIISKPFAVGIRIQHKRSMIDKNQYGEKYKLLPAANYKLTHQCKNKRGVYTFCMCPGGYVIDSSSSYKYLVINGMSDYKRDSENSNSAIIVTVDSKDFGKEPLDGMRFQEELESKAYIEGNGKIPIQLYNDFVNNKKSTHFNSINPVFKGNYNFANLNNIFPKYIVESLIEAIESFDNKIKGFASSDAIISAVESRTSSPVRILRDENLESNVKGIYPAGEGAGYAGGITSSAIDGIKIAEAIMKIYR